MFEQENKFYDENKDSLRTKYLGKEVVIAQNQVIGVYTDVGTAIRETVKTRPLGSFCVKRVPVSPQAKIIRIPAFLLSC
ncbi:hypothetical protein ACYULU_04755 [Breznakiellaceae bacterium SP9]